MAGASRQVVAGDSLLVCPKTWRRRLAVQRAGVADWDEMMSSEVRRPTSLHLLLALTSSMSLRWSLCPQPTLGHQGNLSSCQLDDPQLPTEILTYGHPKLDGWHPGRRRLDGAGPAQKAEAASRGLRQLRRRPVLLAPERFQKQGGGVSLCGALEWLIEDEMRAHGAPQVEIGGQGGRAGSGRCPPSRRLATRGRQGGGTAPPRCRAPATAYAGGRCPVPSSASTANQRPALTGPRVHSWARGVAPSTFRRHGRLRRSARGRRESAELRSVSRPRRDARCTCANAHDLQLERLGDVGRDKRLTSRCSVQRAAIRRGGDLGLALREPYVRRCRGSGDVKARRRADSFSVSGRLPYLHLA